MKILRLSSKEIQNLCERYYCNKKRVAEKVRNIISDVREEGDKAVSAVKVAKETNSI